MRGVQEVVVRVLSFWYSNQVFYIRWGNSLSHGFNISNGVRQGGVLSPFLFNIYIDDLSKSLTGLKIGCNFNGVFINHLIYADDTILIAPSPRAMQRLLDHCKAYADSNFIIYNHAKSALMCIKSKKLRSLSVPTIYLDNNPIKLVDKYKYPGSIVTNDLNDNEDIDREIRNIYSRGNFLVRHFCKCNDEVKQLLFQTFCCTLYSSQLWCHFSNSALKRLTVAFKSIFRKLFFLDHRSSITQEMVTRRINPIQVILRKYMYGFYKRISICDNTIIKALIAWSDFYPSPIFQRWGDILFV